MNYNGNRLENKSSEPDAPDSNTSQNMNEMLSPSNSTTD